MCIRDRSTDSEGDFLDFYVKQSSADKIVKPTNTPGENAPDLSIDDFLAGNYENANFGDTYYVDSDKTSLAGDELTETEARELSPKLNSVLNQIDQGNTGNKIDTSNSNVEMSQPVGGPYGNGSGAQQLSNYLGNARNITPQWRKRDMVDLELSRGGRTSAFIPVGQHRDSPHLGYTNDFANAPGGFLNWYSGGQVSPSGAGNIGQQTDSGNIGGQQASGQGSAAGAGTFGGPNINISNVNNPQAVANTGTIQDSTITNPSTGTASQTTTDNTNTNTNTNTPIVSPVALSLIHI